MLNAEYQLSLDRPLLSKYSDEAASPKLSLVTVTPEKPVSYFRAQSKRRVSILPVL